MEEKGSFQIGMKGQNDERHICYFSIVFCGIKSIEICRFWILKLWSKIVRKFQNFHIFGHNFVANCRIAISIVQMIAVDVRNLIIYGLMYSNQI